MSETITLTTKQANKVEELARNAAELAGQAFEDDKTRYAAVLRLTNRKRQNGGKFTLTCVPGFAKAAIDAAMASGKVATPKATTKATPKASGKLTCAPDTGDSKRGWQARYANRMKHGKVAKVAKVEPLTVESLAARVDSLDAKLDAILAKLA